MKYIKSFMIVLAIVAVLTFMPNIWGIFIIIFLALLDTPFSKDSFKKEEE